jgi:hypothetical protein
LPLVFGLSLSLSASADVPWVQLSRRDGLLPGAVHVLCAGPDDSVAIGTSTGLSLWANARFETHSAGNGLPEGHLTAALWHAGQWWAGSWGGGLGELRVGEGWRVYRAGDSPLPNDWISALAQNEQGLWIATYGGGLARWDGDTWLIEDRAVNGLPSDRLTALAAGSKGDLWVGSEQGGLGHRSADGQWERVSPPMDGQPEITTLLVRDETLWVGTSAGLASLDLRNGQWKLEAAPSGRVNALAVLVDGGLAVGTDRGLALIRQGQRTDLTERDGLAHRAVSALAVDGQGRLWAGSYGRGVSILGEITSPAIQRLPVVLVHGWRGPDSDLLQDSEFWHLARWLRQDGFQPTYATGISHTNTLHQNAARLRQVIAQAKAESGAAQVYLIGFSMGGLNSRAYLESTLYEGDVARAFFLGSPHRGEHLWLPLLAWEALAWTREPSARELFPLHAELFNQTHSQPTGVPYVLVAGDARQDNLPSLFRELPPSDGLVSTWSALGVTGPEVSAYVTPDIHAWSRDTILLDLLSLLLPERSYLGFIRPYLFDAQAAPTPGPEGPAGSYPPPLLDPRSAWRTGRVPAGQPVALAPIPLLADAKAQLLVRWKGAPLTMRLMDPQGRLIEEDDARDRDDIEFLTLDFADFAGYTISNTLPGDWTILLESTSGAAQYVAYASQASPLRLELSADDAWYAPGETAALTAVLRGADLPVAITEARIVVYAPDGAIQETSVLPAQAPGPEAPVTWHVAMPRTSGTCVLAVELRGALGAQLWERSAFISVGIRSTGARLTGEIALPERSSDAASAAIRVGLEVDNPGSYLIAVTLRATDAEVLRVAHPVQLGAGRQNVPVPVGQRWPAGSGAPVVERITLLDINGPPLLADHRVLVSGR